MNLNDLLEEIRAMYVDALEQAIADVRASGADVLVEPALRDASGAYAGEGPHELGLRYDYVVREGDDYTKGMVDSEQMIGFDPGELEYEALTVEIEPFMWDAMQVAIEPADAKVAPLVAWFRRWFDHDESGEGPFGVAHFMSDPIVEDGRLTMEIDLGSASVDAFETLLDACVEAGAERVWLGSEVEEED